MQDRHSHYKCAHLSVYARKFLKLSPAAARGLSLTLLVIKIGDKMCFVAPPARSRLCKTLGQAAPDTRQHLTLPD